jgi:hypothetical protein
MIPKEKLTPYALELFRRVKAALPPQIAARLRSNRHFVTHGSYNDLFLFDVWDSNQTDVLDRKHFKYCLGHDGRPNTLHDGYFHLWLNTIRIYRQREAIVARLDIELHHRVPDGFTFKRHDRAIDIKWTFTYPKNLSTLPDLLLPRYISLISAIHPTLVPIIDQFNTALAPGERRAVVANRGRIPFTHPGIRDPARVSEYTRSISPTLRARILRRHHYRCALCDADLRRIGHHIDHKKPFSRGGTSKPENLQPLCGPCNLAKGNRE